jgi:hypothetical protein
MLPVINSLPVEPIKYLKLSYLPKVVVLKPVYYVSSSDSLANRHAAPVFL